MIDFDEVYRRYSVELMGCADVVQFSEIPGIHFRGVDMMPKTMVAYGQLAQLIPNTQGQVVAAVNYQPKKIKEKFFKANSDIRTKNMEIWTIQKLNCFI